MRPNPLFSVVLATYNRGQHISPTIQSVLAQTCSDFELLVVGDGCTDDTEQVVRSFDNVQWINLPANKGSQSYANNEGIRQAQGRWICYLGHDDIWAPDHLERLSGLIESERPNFAISGCVFHGPVESDVYFITGLFEDSDAAFQHFFPPSSMAHRHDVIDTIGAWRDPLSTAMPVDCDFLLRAAHAGLRFASTGRITVHKFAAGHRYLSYLCPSNEEQRSVLRSFDQPKDDRHQHLINLAQCQGGFMTMQYPDEYATYEKGDLFRRSRQSKGIYLSPLHALDKQVIIEQSDDARGLDWHLLEEGEQPFRWSGPNPRPKILIPYTGHLADMALHLVALAPEAKPQDLSVFVGDEPVTHATEVDTDGKLWLRFVAPLRRSDYTVITLHTPILFCPDEIHGSGDMRRLGIAVSDIILAPH